MYPKTKRKYNKKFQKYLEEEFNPAQVWAASPTGMEYIKNHIPTLDAFRIKENDVLAAVYMIKINKKPVYIGQSLRTVRRLYTHAYHLATDSETYFGIRSEEIETIEVVVSTPPIFHETSRLTAEEAFIKSQKPALQPYYNIPGMRPDACLPRGQARRDAMLQAGIIS